MADAKIATPLTETAYTAREFFTEVRKTTPDGLFTVVSKPLKSVVFMDARGDRAELIFKEPT